MKFIIFNLVAGIAMMALLMVLKSTASSMPTYDYNWESVLDQQVPSTRGEKQDALQPYGYWRA